MIKKGKIINMGIVKSEFIGVKLIDLSDDTTIAPAGTNTQQLQPPVGQCYKLLHTEVNIPDPSGSTTGDHELRCFQNGQGESTSAYWRALSNTGNTINTNTMGWGVDSESPANARDMFMVLGNLIECWATYDNPLDYKYTNDTDVNQTGTRTIKILVAVYRNAL